MSVFHGRRRVGVVLVRRFGLSRPAFVRYEAEKSMSNGRMGLRHHQYRLGRRELREKATDVTLSHGNKQAIRGSMSLDERPSMNLWEGGIARLYHAHVRHIGLLSRRSGMRVIRLLLRPASGVAGMACKHAQGSPCSAFDVLTSYCGRF